MKEDKKNPSWPTFFVSSVALFLAFLSLGDWRVWRADSNGWSVVLASLGCLVTFVVAWQIWQTILCREDIRRIKSLSKELKRLDDKMEMLKTTPEGYVMYTCGRTYLEKHNYKVAFPLLTEACSILLENQEPYEKYPTVIIGMMKECLLQMDDEDRRSNSCHIETIDEMINKVGKMEKLSQEAIRRLNEIKSLILQ